MLLAFTVMKLELGWATTSIISGKLKNMNWYNQKRQETQLNAATRGMLSCNGPAGDKIFDGTRVIAGAGMGPRQSAAPDKVRVKNRHRLPVVHFAKLA